MSTAPNFWEGFAKALQMSSRARGIEAFVPWWLAISIGGSILIWTAARVGIGKIEQSVLINILVGYGVMGGFLGALSIFAMTQIMTTCSTYPFSDYLRQEDLFEVFIFFPQLILLIQILYILYSTVAISFVLLFPLEGVDSFSIFVGAGLTLYATTKTWGLVNLIRVLTWHYEEYSRLYEEAKVKANGPIKA